jgi:uncharacterized membrane protein
MNSTVLALTESLWPESFRLLGWLGLLFLGWRWWQSGDWRKLGDSSRLNVFLAATVALLVLWQIKTGIRTGLSFHLYGIAVLTMMFGFWRACFAGVLILLANALFGRGSLATLGLDAMLVVVLPAVVSWGFYLLLDRKLPNHFFIYVIGNGFFGGALSVTAIGLATTAAMALAGAYQLDYLLEHYTPYTVLIAWAEAFSTGMAVTVMAVYRPQWLETFDDVRYIQNK